MPDLVSIAEDIATIRTLVDAAAMAANDITDMKQRHAICTLLDVIGHKAEDVHGLIEYERTGAVHA